MCPRCHWMTPFARDNSNLHVTYSTWLKRCVKDRLAPLALDFQGSGPNSPPLYAIVLYCLYSKMDWNYFCWSICAFLNVVSTNFLVFWYDHLLWTSHEDASVWKYDCSSRKNLYPLCTSLWHTVYVQFFFFKKISFIMRSIWNCYFVQICMNNAGGM